MELMEIIRNRRSIRKYKDQKIEKEKLEAIVEAGLFAPNPGGRQGTKILLLDDSETIEKSESQTRTVKTATGISAYQKISRP